MQTDQADEFEVALFEGEQQVTGWIPGNPGRFGNVEPGPDRYKARLPDGRVFSAPLPARPTGGMFTLLGPIRFECFLLPDPDPYKLVEEAAG